MRGGSCQEFLTLIKRNFNFLFNEYGFSLVCSEDPGVKGQCLIILQSEDGCQIRFIEDRGRPEISVGSASARLGWTDPEQDTEQWYSLIWIVSYAEGKNRPTAHKLRQLGEYLWSMTEDDALAFFSRMLEPVSGRVVELFRDDMIERKREQLNDYYYGDA